MIFRVSNKVAQQNVRRIDESETMHELFVEGTVRWLGHRRWRAKDYDSFRQAVEAGASRFHNLEIPKKGQRAKGRNRKTKRRT